MLGISAAEMYLAVWAGLQEDLGRCLAELREEHPVTAARTYRQQQYTAATAGLEV